MKLIVGLGNPGKEYENTRHNVGFMLIDALAKEFGFENFKEESKFKAAITSGMVGMEKVVLAKPLTFMNLSGEAVQKLMQFYKVDLSDCLILYDDVDLPLGVLRIRKFGTTGTHNGMKSVVASLGSHEIPRLRVGVESRGVTAPQQQDTSSFVLAPFVGEEQVILKNTLKKAVEAVKMIITEGLDQAMNLYNA